MLEIEQRDEQHGDMGVRIVRLIGEAGVREGHELSLLMPQLAADRPPLLVFDVSELSFISSLGLGELVALARALKKYDCRVCLLGPRREVQSVFDRSKLTSLIGSYESLDAAIAG